MEEVLARIFFSLWTLMLQTDIIFRLQGLLFPRFMSQNIFLQIRQFFKMIKTINWKYLFVHFEHFLTI